MNKKTIFIVLIIIFSLIASTGCIDIFSSDDGSITYESHPTKISCTIFYGYWVNCSGSGDYEINYDCDDPDVLSGQVSSIVVFNDDYEDVRVASFNDIKRWNISSNDNVDYNLGMSAFVVSESFIVSDLNGVTALSIQEIATLHSDLVDQYCRAQSNETATLIDPDNPAIAAKASEIYDDVGTDNSFIVAADLFRWLKQVTSYQTHSERDDVQKSSYTMSCKTGDCDDLSFLYISLCRSVGIPARFIRGFLVEKINNEVVVTPHAWSEVFVGSNIGDEGWISVECAGTANNVETEINQNFGVESASHIRLFKDDGGDESLIGSLSGLSYVRYGFNRDIESEAYGYAIDYNVLESQELKIDKNNIRAYQ